MYRYFFASAILHITLAMVFALWPSIFKPRIEQDNTIVISVVNIGEITNVKISPPKKEPKAKDKEIKADSAPKPPAPATPEPPKEEKPVAKQPPAAPEVKAPKEVAEVIPAPKEKPKPQNKPETPKKPTPKPKPKPAKEKPKTPAKPKPETKEFSEAILKTLEKSQMAKKEKQKKADEVAKMAEELLGKSDKPFDETKPLSIAETDLLKSQLGQYWNAAPFAGAEDSKMEVSLRIVFDIDGNILSVRPINQQANSNPSYAVFVESAVRAVKSASPVHSMPRDKFSTWQEVELRYDSSGMIY